MDNSTLGIVLASGCCLVPLLIGFTLGLAFSPRWSRWRWRALLPMGLIERIQQGWKDMETDMTIRYTAYLLSLSNRDITLIILAGLAAALVWAYIGLDWLPEPIVKTLRPLYLAGGIALYIATMVWSVWGPK